MIRLGRNQMSENLFYQAFDLVSTGIYLCRPGFIAFSNINCAKFSANFFLHLKKCSPTFHLIGSHFRQNTRFLTRSPAQESACQDLGRNGQNPVITTKTTYTPIPNHAGSRPSKNASGCRSRTRFSLSIDFFSYLVTSHHNA